VDRRLRPDPPGQHRQRRQLLPGRPHRRSPPVSAPGLSIRTRQGGRFDDFVKVVGEFGGHGFPVEGHLWNPKARNWGYGGLPKDKDEWLERYRESIRLLAELGSRASPPASTPRPPTSRAKSTASSPTTARCNLSLAPRFPLLPILLLLSGAIASGRPATAAEPRRPNIVVFLSDDHTWRDSSVYGSPDIDTPHMARLAAAGTTFDQAYVASPTCAPSRAALLTGLYPARNGAEPNHSRPAAEIRKLPAYLQELGYEVVSFGKVGHYRQTPEYGFDIARHFGYHEDIAIPEALEWLRQRDSDQPLCLFVGTNWPHVPWPEEIGDVDPASLHVPPNHVDNLVTRQWRARYIAAIRIMDDELGAVYDLAREKLGEDTFFLHTSDHGAQWPFGKWNLYDDGIRTPLIVSWPGRVAAGARSGAMVSWIDILPTLVDVAGGTPPTAIDGRSFLPVLEGKASGHRQVILTTHSGDGDNNVFPIRAARTPDGWKYIRNLHPEFRYTTHVTNAPTDSGYWDSWVDTATAEPEARRQVLRYLERPAEELYRVADDPWEQRNLVDDPEHADRLAELRGTVDRWMEETGDPQAVFGRPKRLPRPEKPNIITVFIDDMGWSDLSCFGGPGRGNREHRSPRVRGGQVHQFLRQLADLLALARGSDHRPVPAPLADHLLPRQPPEQPQSRHGPVARSGSPVLPRELNRAGYATGHFGKWHMGGQRDVGDAPLIGAYGFDRSLTNFEGLGPRVCRSRMPTTASRPRSTIWAPETLGRGPIPGWIARSSPPRSSMMP
jgi:arylsulfatase A-like enzyme